MKAFLLSLLVSISNFLGISSTAPMNSAISPNPTPTIYKEITQTPETSVAQIILSPTPMKTIPISEPSSPITKEVLIKYFGISQKEEIDRIINLPNKITEYEKYFYEKFKTFPIPRVSISNPAQKIYMPSKNGRVVCTGEQLANLYKEIEPLEKDFQFQKMDYDCHYNGAKQETSECREWRLINDQNRVEPTAGGLRPAAEYAKKFYDMQNPTYDRLLEKYCR